MLQLNEVYVIGKMLDLVQCDGQHYGSLSNGQILDRIHDTRIAALFEVGRMLQAHKITPMHGS